MTHELRDQGLRVGRRRTARLMRENGLKARQPRRFKRTTDSRHAFPVAPNLLDQDFSAERPNEKWGADISYIWTREGWLYLAPSSSTSTPGPCRRLGGQRPPAQGAGASRLCDEPSRCEDRQPACFTIRTAAANSARLTIRPNSDATAS